MKVRQKVKRGKADLILMCIVFVIFLLYAISLLFPFLWCIMNSFKEQFDFLTNVNGFPKVWTLANWKESFTVTVDNGIGIPMMYLNSVILTVGCTVLSLLSCSATAYVLSKYDFPGRRVLYSAAIVIMMIPTMGSMASMYKLYNNVGLINTYTGILITSLGGFGTGFLLLHGFYSNLSWGYAEAAQLDGAGPFRIYFRIMLPMAVPALTSVGILQGIGYWNDYFTIYMYAPEKATIAYGIQRIYSESGVNLPKVLAAMMLSIVPVLIVFACFQKVIMNNTSVGGLKG